MTVHSVGNVIIPTDELHHFSEGFKPPTSYLCIQSSNPHLEYTMKLGLEYIAKLGCSWYK